MKTPLYIFLILLCTSVELQSQDSSNVQPSLESDVALVAMTAVLVPLAIAGTIVSYIPPSAGVIVKNGVVYGTFNFQTGIGFGKKIGAGIFTDSRLQIQYSFIARNSIKNPLHLFVTKDFHGEFLDRRKIFMFGVSPEFGLFSDFQQTGYTVGGSVWIMNASLPFFGLFPLHTIGISYHYNSSFSGNNFQDLSIGVASAVSFAW